jgi:hypothetical protein
MLARPVARVWRSARRTATAVPHVIDAVLVLPRLAEHLEVVAFQTATLADMHAELARVGRNTGVLPTVDERLAHVEAALAEIACNTEGVQDLANVALPLHGAAQRFGRFADRIPERRGDPRFRRGRA